MSGKRFNWNEYDQGRSTSQGSVGSAGSHVHWDEGEGDHLLVPDRDGSGGGLRRRRSSISIRLQSFAQAGGVNSIENFARSWQRAVAFHEITPNRNSFQWTEDEPEPEIQRLPSNERTPVQHRSLLRQQFEEHGKQLPETAVHDDSEDLEQGDSSSTAHHIGSPSRDIFSHASHLTGPFSASFGGVYGSLSSRVNDTSREHAARLYLDQQATGAQEPDKEREPLLLRRVEEDGKVSIEVVGQSTVYQTILNSTNVLIGIGLLSLPLGIKYAGWIIGVLFLTAAAGTTAYTARLLGKCLDIDRNMITYADIASVAFGWKAQFVITVIFMLELSAACVALFVLFADSLNILFPWGGVTEYKYLCGFIMVPLSFVPLRLLGYSSSLGIICCITIVLLVILDGLIKQEAPGSLLDPAQTYLFPASWWTLPLSFGLLMSPWGGHAVFPNMYRDMRHPQRYATSLKATFGFTYVLDMSIAVVGLLMFGDETRDEITANILLSEGYPKVFSIIIVTCIAIIPLTKIPLNARPIFSLFEHILGLGPREIPEAPGLSGVSGFSRGIFKAVMRIVITLVIMIIAVVCPSFDRVMALVGSAFCFTICIILPVAFYLKIFGKDVSLKERLFGIFLIVICSAMAAVGTVWAFLPKEITGAS